MTRRSQAARWRARLARILGAALLALAVIGCGANQAVGTLATTTPDVLALPLAALDGRAAPGRDLGPTPCAFAYLPLERDVPIQGVGDEAAITWQGLPLRLTLAEIGELPKDAEPPPGARGFLTTFSISNDSDREVALPLDQLFAGMNSSGERLDEGGGAMLLGPAELTVAAKSSVAAGLQWYTTCPDKDASIWLTFDLPIEASGYIPLDGRGLIFCFRLSELDYPLGTPTPCAMAATFVRETVDDNTPFAPGAHFDKTWVIQNNGTCGWVDGSTWEHVKGEGMGVEHPLPLLGEMPAPGELLTITLPMTAPMALGTYRGEWQLRAPSGDFYGRTFYVQIVVTDTKSADVGGG